MNKRSLVRILNSIGILIMVMMILAICPFTVPKLLGYQLYGILSESMTPAYNVGGVVFVKECNPDKIEKEDVITFTLASNSDVVMTHRVISIDPVKKEFITKGDANNTVDPEPVNFDRIIGKVGFYMPFGADLAAFLHSLTGKAVIFMLFAVSFILWLAADILAPTKKEAGEKEKKKLSKEVIIRNIGIAIVLLSAGYLIYAGLGYFQADQEYEELNELVLQTEVSTESEAVEEEGTELSAVDQNILKQINELHAENPDVIGWIKFENLDISYPIVQAEDNNFYLRKTLSGKKNKAGTIFMEAANNNDFEDYHTIIYGHNMKNLSMFGKLKYYKEDDFYDDHQYFKIYTLDEMYRYQIFAFYDAEIDADIYTIGFKPDGIYEAFLNVMKRNSYCDTGVSVEKEDKVITLSTCSSKGKRFVVNAKRILND